MRPLVRTPAAALLLCPVLALVSSCGKVEPTRKWSAAQTDCRGAEANVVVGDGFLQRNCGCQEGGAGDVFVAPNRLRCTVSAGSVVFFHFVGEQQLHQIIPADGVSFPASQLSDPGRGVDMVREHSVLFSQPGTYEFLDPQGALYGTIFVR